MGEGTIISHKTGTTQKNDAMEAINKWDIFWPSRITRVQDLCVGVSMCFNAYNSLW